MSIVDQIFPLYFENEQRLIDLEATSPNFLRDRFLDISKTGIFLIF